jgi:hypothetical protein
MHPVLMTASKKAVAEKSSMRGAASNAFINLSGYAMH